MEFVSKFKRYRLWLVPSRYLHDNFGQRTFQQGICARFEDNHFETKDDEMVRMMLASPRYGLDFHSTEQVTDEQLSSAAQNQIKDEQQALDTTLNACPKCTFKAKTKLGLMSHIRSKHPEKQ